MFLLTDNRINKIKFSYEKECINVSQYVRSVIHVEL